MIQLYGLSNLIGAVTNSTIALFVYFKGRHSKLSKIWAFFTFCVAIYGFGAYMAVTAQNYDSAFFWWQVSYVGVILLPALFLHFVLSFLEIKKPILLNVVYVITFLIWIANIVSKNLFIGHVSLLFTDSRIYKPAWWVYPPGPLHIFHTLILYFGLLTYAMILLIKSYRSASRFKQNQIKYFSIAMILGFAGGGTSYLPCFGINLYPVFNITVPLYTFIIAYTIIRHQLMDISVVIKKTLVFASLFAIVLGIFIGITLITQELIVGGKILGLAISSIIIIFAVRPLEDFLVKVTDKYLFQKKYDYKQILKSFIDEVITVLSLDRILESTIDLLNKTLHPKNVDILLFNKHEDKYVSYKAIKRNEILTVGNDAQLILLLKSTNEIISMESSEYLSNKSLTKEMEKLKAELIIPLTLNDDLIGVMILGKKKSDEEYNKEDIDILTDLARTEAIAIKNSQVLNELAEQKKVADLGKMMSFLSHNINNHLGRARNRLQTIMYTEDVVNKLKDENLSYDKRKDIAEKLSQHLDLVDKYIEASASVVKKARDFAKPSQGAFASLNVEKSLNTAIDMVKELKYKKSVRQIPIYLEIEKGIPGANAKEEDLREVTIAILDNAMDAIRMKELQLGKDESDNVKVKVAHLKNANQIEIRFIDTGIGIKPEDKESIFLPYFTTKGSSALYESFARRKEIESGNSQEDKVVGTGLGLDLVKNLVENLMKGSMRIESEYKKGATFIVNIPVWSETRI
ncbi:MAG: GAF domain-containing protein [Candidatus Omnitrophica bacterium]|nr:GAF domain-containing protein [Candidatus Omnitrophota bacterium]